MKRISKFLAITITVAVVFVFIGLNLNKPGVASSEAVEWSYTGNTGPDKWGELSEEFKLCGSGQSQSPINIEENNAALRTDSFGFDYKYTPLEILNNGHTIQLNYEAGSSIQAEDIRYELAQFHFHSPSEHEIDGNKYPLEIHLVHKNASGQLAVIGVLVQEGKANSFITTLWAHLQLDPGGINLRRKKPIYESRYK
ncbi:MAG: carbonic anhydrase [Microcoleaceae cyanobacterium]